MEIKHFLFEKPLQIPNEALNLETLQAFHIILQVSLTGVTGTRATIQDRVKFLLGDIKKVRRSDKSVCLNKLTKRSA